MTIITVQFDYPGAKTYKTLMDVFKYSLSKNFPDARLKVYSLTPNNNWQQETFRRGFHSNKIKFDKWVEALDEIKDDHIIFMDCDMLVLKPLDCVFRNDFDIGITYRRVLPYNGGVLFARNNKNARYFLKLWGEIDEKMYYDFKFLTPWRSKYAGLNQASLGYLLENKQLYSCKIEKFPCSIWNECGENRYNEHIKCVHIKSGIRRSCLSRLPLDGIDFHYRGHAAIWRQYAIEAGVYDVKEKHKSVIKKKNKMRTKPKIKIAR